MAGVIITGGFGVLGGAVATAFKSTGWKVALIDRASKASFDAQFAIGEIDLADPTAAELAFVQASEAVGGVQALVNVAGAFRFELVDGGDVNSWDHMYAANLKTCFNMCRAAAARLPVGGSIVNIGAASAQNAGTGMAPYAASKAGVARLTESLAAELKGNVRVNAVLPLILDTPQNRADMPSVDPASWTAVAALADVIVFLASDASRAINGALVPVTAPSRR